MLQLLQSTYLGHLKDPSVNKLSEAPRHPSSRFIISIALQVLLTALNFILMPRWLWPVGCGDPH